MISFKALGALLDYPTGEMQAAADEIDHERSPTVSVARTLTVSLHPASRVGSRSPSGPSRKSIHATNRPLPRCSLFRTPPHPAPSTATTDATPDCTRINASRHSVETILGARARDEAMVRAV